MATFNAPVATVLWDRDYTVVIKITGQYNAAANASNSVMIQANTVRFADASKKCYLDVVNIQYSVSTANGFISLEYVGSNSNATIATFGRGGVSGHLDALIPNILGANASGDLNLYTSRLDANDNYSMIVTLRKNDFNGAFANVGLAYS